MVYWGHGVSFKVLSGRNVSTNVSLKIYSMYAPPIMLMLPAEKMMQSSFLSHTSFCMLVIRSLTTATFVKGFTEKFQQIA